MSGTLTRAAASARTRTHLLKNCTSPRVRAWGCTLERHSRPSAPAARALQSVHLWPWWREKKQKLSRRLGCDPRAKPPRPEEPAQCLSGDSREQPFQLGVMVSSVVAATVWAVRSSGHGTLTTGCPTGRLHLPRSRDECFASTWDELRALGSCAACTPMLRPPAQRELAAARVLPPAVTILRACAPTSAPAGDTRAPARLARPTTDWNGHQLLSPLAGGQARRPKPSQAWVSSSSHCSAQNAAPLYTWRRGNGSAMWTIHVSSCGAPGGGTRLERRRAWHPIGVCDPRIATQKQQSLRLRAPTPRQSYFSALEPGCWR